MISIFVVMMLFSSLSMNTIKADEEETPVIETETETNENVLSDDRLKSKDQVTSIDHSGTKETLWQDEVVYTYSQELLRDEVVYETVEEAGAVLREALFNRNESLTISVAFYPDESEDILTQARVYESYINNAACIHNGNPRGGDYLGHYASRVPVLNYVKDEDRYILTIDYTFRYNWDEEQEAELEEEVARIIASLDLEGKTDYEKIEAICKYMAATVEYEFVAHCYDAYGPLVEKKGVCEGISLAVYRLLLEAGIDNRQIQGVSGYGVGDGINHAWNIVKLGEY